MQFSPRVLLVGSGDRAALEVVRSLGKRKIDVFTIYFLEKTLCEQSRYCKKGFFLGNPEKDYSTFSKTFQDHFNEHNYDLVIPINDHANEIIFDHFDFLKNRTSIAGPSFEQYVYAQDKIKTLVKCKEAGVPVPRTKIIDTFEPIQWGQITYPIYAKPQYSSLLRNGKLYNFSVRKISSEDQLDNFLRDNINTCKVMLQDPIGGYGVGMNVAAKDGDILSFGITRRLHEPPDGGNSSYRESIPLDEKLEEYAKKLVKALNWTGLAMLEFKFDGNDYYLMEINPRLWGSVGLSKFSGVDFPAILYNLFSHEKIHLNTNYVPGKFSRNLTRDVHWALRKLAKKQVKEVVMSVSSGIYRMIVGQEKIDEFSIRDLRPFFQSLIQIVRRYSRSIISSKTKIERRIGISNISRGTKVLFICKGNINRSAFASEYLRQRYDIPSDSAGSLLKRNRSCSKNAALASKEFSVDMSNHRSQSVYDVDLNDYDYYILFDDLNYTFMVNEFPEKLSKLRYLVDGHEVKDPHHYDLQFFIERFEIITQQIDKLVKATS